MAETMNKLEGVSVDLKANIYFDGKVVSHSFFESNGVKKTLGLIYPGSFTFNTGAPERMMILAGTCKVRLAGEKEERHYSAGSEFRIPENSSFEIAVDQGIAEYLCIFE